MDDRPQPKESLFARSAYDYFGEAYMRAYPDDLSKFKPLIDEFAASLPPGARVLDVGCGDGAYVAYFLELGFDALGLDISETMLSKAGRLVPKERLLLKDMHFLDDIETASFDAVLSITSLVYTSRASMERILEELKRILKPGGKMLLMMLEGDGEGLEKESYEDRFAAVYCSYYTDLQLRDVVSRIGFDVDRLSVTRLVVVHRQEITLFLKSGMSNDPQPQCVRSSTAECAC